MGSISLQRLQKTAYSLFIFISVVWIMMSGSIIILPLVWSAFFAFALYPISNWLEERRFPRALAISLTLILVTTIAVTVFYLLTNQVLGLIADIPEIQASFEEKMSVYLSDISEYLGMDSGSLPSTSEILKQQNLESALFETGRSLVLLGVLPLFIFLMLYYKDFFVEFLRKISKNGEHAFLNWIRESGGVIQSYLVGDVDGYHYRKFYLRCCFLFFGNQILSFVRGFYCRDEFDPLCGRIIQFLFIGILCAFDDRQFILSFGHTFIVMVDTTY
jgi:predicted PurR-regulated permease PerM